MCAGPVLSSQGAQACHKLFGYYYPWMLVDSLQEEWSSLSALITALHQVWMSAPLPDSAPPLPPPPAQKG